MARKDSEKRREYNREWRKKNKEKNREYRIDYFRNRYIKKHPNVKRRFSGYYDFETHRELAINSGIENMPEWIEVHQMGLMPDGIYRRPDQYLKNTLPPSAIVSRNRRCTYKKVE